MKKKNDYKSNIRSIRNAISSAHFPIQKYLSNGHIVEFNNQEDGWDFKKRFVGTEMLNFYQDLDRAYKLYAELFSIKLLLIFLATNFLST